MYLIAILDCSLDLLNLKIATGIDGHIPPVCIKMSAPQAFLFFDCIYFYFKSASLSSSGDENFNVFYYLRGKKVSVRIKIYVK